METPSKRKRIVPWKRFICALVPNWLARRKEISHGAKLLYGFLAQHAGKRGLCYPSQKTLGTELGVGVRTICTYLKELLDFQLIGVIAKGNNRNNRYAFFEHEWIRECDLLPEYRAAHQRETFEGDCGDQVEVVSKTLEPEEPFRPDGKKSSSPERKNASVPLKDPLAKGSEEEIHTPLAPEEEGECDQLENSLSRQAEKIFRVYPKQAGRPAALKAIRRAIQQHGFALVLERTQLYVRTYQGDPRFIPHPARWYNEERFIDDPLTWSRPQLSAKSAQPPRQFSSRDYQQDPTKL